MDYRSTALGLLETGTHKVLKGMDTLASVIRSAVRSGLLFGRTGARERFVPFSQRAWLSDLPLSLQFIRAVQETKWRGPGVAGGRPMHWKGVPLIKDPFNMALYPILIWELKPRTIIELGAYLGGSASWLADLALVQGLDCRVYSHDIDVSRIKVSHPRVSFRAVDCARPETLGKDFLAQLPHPWLLVEDSHVNTGGILEFFDPLTRPGDYWVIEDTALKRWKHEQLRAFLAPRSREERYRVDTRFTDLYGYNTTFNLNGVIVRI